MLNSSISREYAATYRRYRPDTLAILCSDARVPTSRLVFGHKFFVMRTAGNVFDPQAELLPDTLQYAVVIGHERDPGTGCGACDTARAFREDPGAASAAFTDRPELEALVREVRPDVRENVRAVADVLRGSTIFDRSRVYAMIYSHTEALALVPDGMPAGRPTDEISRHSSAMHAGFGPLELRDGLAIDVRSGQQPLAIVVNSLSGILGRSFGHFFPSVARRFLQPNAVFEAKSPTASVTERQLASAEYALAHALRDSANFSDTSRCFLVADSSRRLEAMWDLMAARPSVRAFEGRGGRLFGLVPAQDLSVTFYSRD